MSVSSAGAGANKQIRYSVIIDTAQLETKLKTLGMNLKTAFESGNTSITNLGTGIKNVSSQMTTTTSASNTFSGSLKTFSTNVATSATGITTMSNSLRTFNSSVQTSSTTLNLFSNALRQFNTGTQSTGVRVTTLTGALNQFDDSSKSTRTSLTSLSGAIANSNTRTEVFTGALGTFSNTAKTTTASVDGTNSSVSIMSGNFNKLATGGLDKTNTLTRMTGESFDKLEKQTGKTSSKIDKLKEGFAGNRGLIYSMGTIFGTITGVVAEFQLLDDAQTQVAEATAKLTQLEKDGQKGTAAYTQAMQQKEKAERFASFTTRNLALAVSNFVPEILLLTTTLAKGGGVASKLGGLLGKLKTGLVGLPALLTGIGTAGSAASVGLNAFAAGLARVAAPIVAATSAIAGIALAFQQAQADVKLASGDIQTKLEGLQEFFNGWKDIPVIGPLLKAIIEPLGILPQITVKAGKGVKDLGEAIKFTNNVVQTHIPTIEHLKESTRGLYDGNTYVEKSYVQGAKTLDMFNLKQQQTGTLTNKLYQEFKSQTQTTYEYVGALEDGTKVFRAFGTGIEQVTTSLKDHGKEITNGAQQQYDYDQQITTSMQGWTKYQEILVNFDQEMNNSFGIWAKAGDVVVKTGEGYVDLGNAAKLAAMSEENRNATIEDAIRINEEYNQSVQDSIDKMKLVEQQKRDALDTEKILNTVGITHNQIMSADVGQTDKLKNAIVDINFAYKDEEIRLAKLLLQHGKLTPELAAMALSTEDNTAALAKAAVGLEDTTKTEKDTTKATDDLAKAQEEAAKKVEAFHKAIADANKELEDNALNLADALKVKLPDPDKFLKKLLKAFPKSIRKDMEVKIDLIAKKQELEKDFKDIISVALEANEKGEFVFDPNIVPDDKSADKFAKGLITDITKTFGDTPPTKFAVLQQKIQAAIASPKTGEELVKIFTEAGFLTKIEGVGETWGEKLAAGIPKGWGETQGDLINNILKITGNIDVIPTTTKPTQGTTTTNTIKVDNSQAIKAMDMVVKRLDFIAKMKVVPIITVDIKSAISLMDNVVKRLEFIGKMRPIPVITVNIKSAIKSMDTVVKRLEFIGKMRPVPKITVNIESALKSMDTVVKRLESINKMHANPKITVTQTTVKKVVTQAAHATLSDSNLNAHASNNGMLNVTIVNEDEFGQKKLKRFKSQLGKESYRFA